jgi:transaldolase/fructose-6-phosphate aldolase 1
LIACGARAVTVRPEFAAGLATDPLKLAAMAQFDKHTEASLKPFLMD